MTVVIKWVELKTSGMRVDRNGDRPGRMFEAIIVELTELQPWCSVYGWYRWWRLPTGSCFVKHTLDAQMVDLKTAAINEVSKLLSF